MRRLLRLALSFLGLLPLGFINAQAIQDPPCSSQFLTTSPGNIGFKFEAGNPGLCEGGFRAEPPKVPNYYANGTYEVVVDNDGNKIKFTVSNPGCGQLISWEAPEYIVVEKVVMKGGDGANIYNYANSNLFADGNLHCPTTNSGNYADISHIDFCFKYKLIATKDAKTSYTREYQWGIKKSVSPEAWNFFCGDKGTSTYKVTAENTGSTEKDFLVQGTITIENKSPQVAKITDIDDVLTDNINAVLTYPAGFSLPYDLPARGKLIVGYSASLPTKKDGINTVTVITSTTNVVGDEGTAEYKFGEPTTEVNESVNVKDDNYTPEKSWVATVGKINEFTYTREFDCTNPADDGKSVCDGTGAYEFKNTATIFETDASSSATVSVKCYKLEVTKTANTSLTRTWNWTINKKADQTSLILSTGQPFDVNYEVTVYASPTDSKWAVSGEISVKNPAPVDAVINSISDLVTKDIAATVDCKVTFPYTLKAGETLTCTYTADLTDASERTNTATATLQNYSTAADGEQTPSSTTDFSGTALVDFTKATITENDECIKVTDSYAGVLGEKVCVTYLPKTFKYSRQISYAVCGEYVLENTASFETSDLKKTGSASFNVNVSVPCGGCTLTQGYWKTHSSSGPAPYDNAWLNLGPDEQNTIFFLSGMTWYQVFWTAPAGDAYYNLAHQYMAAKLNILNGAATTPAVTSAIAAAEALFSLRTPSNLTNGEDRSARSLATTLDQYNNGLIGPGHCDEQNETSAIAGRSAPVGNIVDASPAAPAQLIQPGLRAWPNPTSAGFNLVLGSENLRSPVQLKVYDMNGRLVYSATGTANKNFSFGQGMAKGIYLAEVIQDNNRQVTRLIKQ
jgi:hypothetical protein